MIHCCFKKMSACNLCPWCAEAVMEEGEICAGLKCKSTKCGDNVYHQACIEDYLRKAKLQPSRLTGFACPR